MHQPVSFDRDRRVVDYRVQRQVSDGELRLNKYLSEAGLCSRREADRLIEAGRVQVDGRAATPGQKVAKGQRVLVDGREVVPEQELILLAVNKPRGVVCTTDRRWGDRTIYDVVDCPKRIFSVGRLDKDSEGLLLMTNYGDILNKILRAGNYHEKEYLVTVDREISKDFLKKMAEGVYLDELDTTTRPCSIRMVGKCQFRIVLTQGLNRQIRRMCEALHYRVKRLVRVRIMNIELGDLKPGEYRPVTRKEFAQLQEQLRHSTNPGQQPKRQAADARQRTQCAETAQSGKSGTGWKQKNRAGQQESGERKHRDR